MKKLTKFQVFGVYPDGKEKPEGRSYFSKPLVEAYKQSCEVVSRYEHGMQGVKFEVREVPGE